LTSESRWKRKERVKTFSCSGSSKGEGDGASRSSLSRGRQRHLYEGRPKVKREKTVTNREISGCNGRSSITTALLGTKLPGKTKRGGWRKWTIENATGKGPKNCALFKLSRDAGCRRTGHCSEEEKNPVLFGRKRRFSSRDVRQKESLTIGVKTRRDLSSRKRGAKNGTERRVNHIQ